MANTITKYMSQKAGKTVTNADLLNTVRDNAIKKGNLGYAEDIPELKHLQPINHHTVPYTLFQVHENEFFAGLINKIASTVISALQFESPLAVFKTEDIDFGSVLEEIYIAMPDAQDYDGKTNQSPDQYFGTDLKVFYHELTEEKVYPRTIEREWAVKAFRSDSSFDAFVDGLLTTMLTAKELYEYEQVKQVLTNALTGVNIAEAGQPAEIVTTPHQEFDLTQDGFIQTFNKELIKRSNLFATPSRTRFENAAKVPRSTPIEDQYLIVTAEFSAELDSMLANAFNMDKASVLAHKIVVDELPEFTGAGDLNGAKPFAILLDKKAIKFKDKLLTMNHRYNERALRYNYFLHHHFLLSFSLIENMRVYYTL